MDEAGDDLPCLDGESGQILVGPGFEVSESGGERDLVLTRKGNQLTAALTAARNATLKQLLRKAA